MLELLPVYENGQRNSMTKTKPEIVPYDPSHHDAIIELSIRAWTPVFPLMKKEIPDYVYGAFYPDGWKQRQVADISATCRDSETNVWVALTDGEMSGYVGVRIHEEDSMGEIYVIAVDPDYQRQGICSALMSFAFGWLRRQGLAMVMIETGGDEGHAPARAAYENAGFERYPVARYFRNL